MRSFRTSDQGTQGDPLEPHAGTFWIFWSPMPEALPIFEIVEPHAGGPANFLTLWSPMPEALPIFEIVEPRAAGPANFLKIRLDSN